MKASSRIRNLVQRTALLLLSLVLLLNSLVPIAFARDLIDNGQPTSLVPASGKVIFSNDPGVSQPPGTPTVSAPPQPASATPTVSYATASASLQPVIASAQNPFEDSLTPNTSENAFSQTLLQLLAQSLDTRQAQQLTHPALPKGPATVIPLSRKTFKANEPIAITILNAKPDELKISVTDPLGKQIGQELIGKSQIDNQTVISLKPSRIGIRPGTYTVHITDGTGNTTTQNFTWGVLAVNTNKSMYTPEQTAHIAMSVLDEHGGMVCDAQVVLEITDPAGAKTILSTAQNTATNSVQPSATSSANQPASASDSSTVSSATASAAPEANSPADTTITVNPQCLSHNFSLTPDYEASYQVHKTGQYNLTLSATTKNGTNTITDGFSVADVVPFDVERVSATRIYPPNRYPMLFHIQAHQDFTGTIIETAPPNFDITPYATGSSQEYSASSLVMPVTDMLTQFGTPFLALANPFSGDYRLTQGFGVELTDPKEKAFYQLFGLAGHDGLDFALPMGTPVLATDDGTVSLAGDGAYGTTIVIDHTWGKSYYGHLSKTEVTAGQKITKGQEIGLSGNTGHSTGAHLHFGIKPKNPNMENGFYGKVDPAPYLGLTQQPPATTTVWTTSSVPNANKVISWMVSLKNGESIDLGYSYKAPGLSPQLYALGPLTFVNNKQTVFQEARLWQVAVDGNSTAGPNNCGTAVDDSSSGGTIAWGTPGNVCLNGGSANASLTANNFSHYLKVTNFGFTTSQIPTGSKIIGIQFFVTKREGTGTGTIFDQAVRDVKGGTIDSGNDHSLGTQWSGNICGASGTTVTYGSSSDLWGQTWAVSDITSSNFGIALAAIDTAITHNRIAAVCAFVTATITYNAPPNAPSQDYPANNVTNDCITPQFNMTASDGTEADNLQYKVTIYSNSACTAVVQTNDETSSQTGWSGRNATCSVANDCYTSGTQATFSTQTPLSTHTQYWWKASAIDPLGSNTFTDSSTCNTFTTGPTLDALLRHGKWFCSDGTLQPFTY